MGNHPGLRLEWAPQELSRLQEMNSDLRQAIWGAPCLASSKGENTYECRHDNLCRVCEWRMNVMKDFQEDYNESL